MDDQQPRFFSPGEVSRLTGLGPERLRELRSLGLIDGGSSESFRPQAVERLRLIALCLEHGFDARAIALAEEKQQGFVQYYLDQIHPNGIGPTYSVSEVAAATGLDAALVRRLWEAIGFGEAPETIRAEDVEVLRGWKVALDHGFPQGALMQLIRVYADALGRVAEAEARLFHFYVHEKLRGSGLSGTKLTEITEAAAAPMRALIEPAILYFHRKGMARALRDDMLMHLAEHVAPEEPSDAPGELRRAIVFVDLASFTPLAESMGDVTAAEVVQRFSELVREVVNTTQGRVVERIGDAFLIVFPEARSAVSCALEIDRRAAAEPQFPAVRGGVNVGRLLYREGGYVGSALNLAARVAAEARPHQTLVTSAVRADAAGLDAVEFAPLGKRRLKGVRDEIELFQARSKHAEHGERIRDPICGIEMAPAEIAAKLFVKGREVAFCCEKCLQIFLEAPRGDES